MNSALSHFKAHASDSSFLSLDTSPQISARSLKYRMPRIKLHTLSLRPAPPLCGPGTGPGPHPPSCASPWDCPLHHCPSSSPADVSQVRPFPSISTSTAIVQASIKFHKFHRGSLSAHILPSVLPTTANLILSHFCFEKKKNAITPKLP